LAGHPSQLTIQYHSLKGSTVLIFNFRVNFSFLTAPSFLGARQSLYFVFKVPLNPKVVPRESLKGLPRAESSPGLTSGVNLGEGGVGRLPKETKAGIL